MINIPVNNKQVMTVEQDEARELILVSVNGRKDGITEADFVMLINYYQYIKDNDIKCDFINYYGKNNK